MRRFKNEEVLRVGLHDVAGALDVEQVARQLSDLADVCVEACFDLAKAEIEKRNGAGQAALSVVALGKLGGRELGYHSDLDLLFIYSSPDEQGTNHEYFARLAQKLISHLALQLREGNLYRIDTRLRPSGSAGSLVISFEALASYHAREARLLGRWARPARRRRWRRCARPACSPRGSTRRWLPAIASCAGSSRGCASCATARWIGFRREGRSCCAWRAAWGTRARAPARSCSPSTSPAPRKAAPRSCPCWPRPPEVAQGLCSC